MADVEPWIYQFCDLATDREITTLSLTAPTFDSLVGQAGPFQASIHLPWGDAEFAARVASVFPPENVWPPPAGPGRVKLHVYQGPTMQNLWDSYIVWEAPSSGDAAGREVVNIRGAQIASYMWHRCIWDDLAYAQEDQIDMAHSLVADMQVDAGGDIGIQISGAMSGVLRDKEYPASSSVIYGQALSELASMDDGFEWVVRSYVDGGVRVHEFVTGYPDLSTTLGVNQELYLSKPGNLISYNMGNSALVTANRYRARGDTVNDDLTQKSEPSLGNIITDTALTGAGFLYLDAVVDKQGITAVTELDAYARWWKDTRSGVISVPELVVEFDGTFPLHTGLLGQYLNVTIVSTRYPLNALGQPTFTARWRLIGISVTPNGRGQGRDVARLTLENGSRL